MVPNKILLIISAVVLVSLLIPFPARGYVGEVNSISGNPIPGDMVLETKFELEPYGLTYERNQQYFGNARVLGGQITIYLDSSGAEFARIGTYYPNISPSNALGLSKAAANGIVSRDIGAAGERIASLIINPLNGQFFYRVETRRMDSRWVHWIDAASGAVINRYDALTYGCDALSEPCGFGVAYDDGDQNDVKDLTGLVTQSGSSFQLRSLDGRQETYDQGSSRRPFLGPIATDSDNSWIEPGNESPAQGALVDVQYYANLTDDYYLNRFGYDWVSEANAVSGIDGMELHAHFRKDYSNAYWNGSYAAFGDGDGVTFRELTNLEIVAHELTHGLTEFTSNLVYQNESGALNEAFSDILGNSAEFYADTMGLEPGNSQQPDWSVGEDIDLSGDDTPGFRNMADPTEDGDPSHYADRYTGSSDNGGVHINSGIANHWYYLLVNGGQNANPVRASGTNVAGIGLSAAESIAYLGFIALTENATFCDARQATIAVAGANIDNVTDAWDEVGVDAVLCDSSQNSTPIADFSYSVSGLDVDFTDQSSDLDGYITDWSWDFGDNNGALSQNPSHTYAAGGSYTVSLAVTDDLGSSDTVTQTVTVSELSGFLLAVNGYKVKGKHTADLTWSGFSSVDVDIIRNGELLTTTSNDGFFTDNIGNKGSGSYTYQVCESGTPDCSNEVNIIF